MQVYQGAVGEDQEPVPQHRVDAPNPGMGQIDGGLRRRVHQHGSLTRYRFIHAQRVFPEEPGMELVCPRLEMDSL